VTDKLEGLASFRKTLTRSRSDGREGKWTLRGERSASYDIGGSDTSGERGMSVANAEVIEGERGPKGVAAGEGYASTSCVGGREGTECARTCPPRAGETRKVVESGEVPFRKGAVTPGILGLVTGEVSTEFVIEFTGDVRGEDVAEPIGEFNREDTLEPFKELRRGFPLERSTTAGGPVGAGEAAGDMAAGEDDVRMNAKGLVMTTCAGLVMCI
jgi:hypothetical protein